MSEPQNHRNTAELTVITGVIFLLVATYTFGYAFFNSLGFTNHYVDGFIRGMANTFALGGKTDLIYKAAAVFFSGLYAMGMASKKYIDTEQLPKQMLIFFISIVVFALNYHLLLIMPLTPYLRAIVYIISSIGAYILLSSSLIKILMIKKQERLNLSDKFNEEGEEFEQVDQIIGDGEYSVHIPAVDKKGKRLWWNYVNPFSGTIVTGNPGTGKSFVHIIEFVRQCMLNGFTICLYDYKNELTDVVYRYLAKNHKKIANHPNFKGKILPKFNVLNFDDPRKSVRMNPLDPALLTDIADCKDIATVFMHNINKSWIEKRGDFFPESAVTLVASLIIFLRYSALQRLSDEVGKDYEVDLGNCCTLPHVISLLHCPRIELFSVLANHPATKIVFTPFAGAINDGAGEQLSGQLATTQIALATFATPKIYWALTGNDCSAFISDRNNPQYLCLVNNEQRNEVYGPALSMILGQVVKKINTKNNLPSLLSVDELATVYIKDIDKLIATARSNRVAVLLGFQDFTQLIKDYGKKVADVVITTVGNLVSGKVMKDSAKDLQEVFGKMKQKRMSISHSHTGSSLSESEQMDYVIPASKISSLSQGEFVLRLQDTIEHPLKIKYAKATADIKSLGADRLEHPNNKNLMDLPRPDMQDFDITEQMLSQNFKRVEDEVRELLEQEIDLLGLRESVIAANAG